jgi:NADPH:quinone reductase-like Zn-dependent oxidoreductase
MALPKMMTGIVLTGHGGPEKLHLRHDLPVPVPKDGEVLIRVAASAVNNTDINTRIGWYSKAVDGATSEPARPDVADASWSGVPLQFPRIQGADCCGHVVAVGQGVDPTRIGERVIVRNMLRSYVEWRPYECWTFGSEVDGGFAQFAVAPSRETHAVRCNWSDAELASIPCAWSTAENMLHRAQVGAERVLITGASGGVGSAAVQLAKRRGAFVIALTGATKAAEVRALGADLCLDRGADLRQVAPVDVVIDMVGGAGVPSLLGALRPGGRYAVAGAIAGPICDLDLRTLYLKDLTLYGCTFQEDEVFANLIRYIEAGEIRPTVARTYPLAEIAQAQADFLSKSHTGKLVLIPPELPQ